MRPATFMEMVVDTGRLPDDGTIRFLMEPLDTLHAIAAIAAIAADDVGRVVAEALAGPRGWSGREFNLVGESIDGEAFARLLSEHWRTPIRYEQLPAARPDGDPLLSRLAWLIHDGPLGGGIRAQGASELPRCSRSSSGWRPATPSDAAAASDRQMCGEQPAVPVQRCHNPDDDILAGKIVSVQARDRQGHPLAYIVDVLNSGTHRLLR